MAQVYCRRYIRATYNEHVSNTLDIQDPIGRRVRSLRLQQALTQLQLAKRARIGRVAVIRLERGARVQPSTVRAVARALGVAPTKLTIG
jgi:transcriptional regulator with XRE-family HTH domain